LVFHSNGVTKREPEIHYDFTDIDILYLDDYSQQETTSGYSKTKRALYSKKLLKLFKLLSECNTTLDFEKTKFWVISVRGHYSYRQIRRETVYEVTKILEHLSGSRFIVDGLYSIAIHYRLGDLLALKNKYFIDEESLHSLFKKQEFADSFEQIEVFSDTPELAKEKLINLNYFEKVNAKSLDVIDSISQICRFKYFIGTNSKISILSILIRLYTDDKTVNFLPIQLKTNLFKILSDDIDTANLYFY
jgi:hypothetical protein